MMWTAFKDSLKALEADIQYANNLASEFPRDVDGACLQMRLSYSPCAHLLLFLVQWRDCHLAGTLGLLRIIIHEAYANGKTTISIYERKASLSEFYNIILPSLSQLQGGINEIDDRKQRDLCASKYKRKDGTGKRKLTEIDKEREEECGICMEITTKVVLPNCSHALCIKCYRDWRKRSQSCPFCRDSLKRVNSGDLWIYTHSQEIDDLNSIKKQNVMRLFMYVETLPLIVPDPTPFAYNPHFRLGGNRHTNTESISFSFPSNGKCSQDRSVIPASAGSPAKPAATAGSSPIGGRMRG